MQTTASSSGEMLFSKARSSAARSKSGEAATLILANQRCVPAGDVPSLEHHQIRIATPDPALAVHALDLPRVASGSFDLNREHGRAIS